MTIGTESARCLNCGQPLSGLAPAGVCARCLLLTGFDETNVATGIDDTVYQDPASNNSLPSRRFGDYELIEEIARGGMGIVYKARQISLDRVVAVKMLLFGQYASDEFIHRFRIEASAAASLQHPNIVAIHEVGMYQGQHYFAMDLVDGPDLARMVRDKPLAPHTAARYAKAMADAIQFAHQRRILHRDLKPSNVLIDSNDQPRITDFGLAKKLSEDSDLTATGQVLGSPSYMPPEQASAERGRIGPASDVYSLGAILYHTLTGRAPFVGQTLADTLEQVFHKEPIAARLLTPSVPKDLETICFRCLEKEPAKRYATAQELAEELNRFLRDEPIHARAVTRAERAWRWCRRNPALSTAVAFVLVLLLILGIGSPVAALRIRHAQRESEENLYVGNIYHANVALEAHELTLVHELFRGIEGSRQQRAMRGWEWRYLVNRARSDERLTLGRHEAWLADLAFSPDRQRLATISADGVVKLWDMAAEKEMAEWPAHANIVEGQPDWPHHAVIFTPDGSTIITAGQDGAIRFWNSRSRQQMHSHSITHVPYPVNRLAISPDGTLLAGQGWGHRVYLWKLSEGPPEQVQEFETNSEVPFGIGFSPDGETLLVGWADQPIVRYDISTPNSRHLLEPLVGATPPFVFSPDGKWLVTAGSSRHIVRRWTWPDLAPLPQLRVRGGNAAGFAISPDTRLLVAGLGGGQLNSWDLTNREPQDGVVFHGHEESIAGVAFGRNDDGVKLASISWDKTVRLWDPAGPLRQEIVMRLGAPVLAVAISPDARYLATAIRPPRGGGDSKPRKMYTLQLWELKTGLEVAPSLSFGGNGLGPRLVFSPDSKQIAVSDFEALEFYEIPTLQLEAKAGHRGPVYSADGHWLAYIGSGKRIITRTSLETEETVLVTGKENLQQLALSPDGRTLASSTDHGGISFWDARTGRCLGPLSGHTLRVPSLAFTPDGKTFVSAGWDGRLSIWDVASRRNLAMLRGHNNGFNCAVISPDGGTIATGGDDSTLRLWNLARRQEIAVLHSHIDSVNDLCFSRDGEWLASGSDDGTVHLWHAPSLGGTNDARGAR